jgi:putative addiction module component (TIGR02574 family)
MSDRAEPVFKDALSLSPSERAELVDQLLASLDPPTQEKIDELWALEAEDRLNSFERGEMQAIPAKDVFENLNKRKV